MTQAGRAKRNNEATPMFHGGVIIDIMSRELMQLWVASVSICHLFNNQHGRLSRLVIKFKPSIVAEGRSP